VTTQPAGGISDSGAQLNGYVTPGLNPTTVWFEWGSDVHYGNSTPPQIIPASMGASSFNNLIAGLAAGAVYHYRAVASNALGIVFGMDSSFTTGFPSFSGEWYNIDPSTRDMPMLTIEQSDTNWTVHGYGACSPTDCDWGETTFYPMADSVDSLDYTQGFAVWEFGFSTVYTSFKLDAGRLEVENFTVFHDNSGRSDYYFVNTMTRAPVVTLRLQTPNQLLILWPYEATNFVLQSTTSCGPAAVWSAVTNEVSVEVPDFVTSGRVSSMARDVPANGCKLYCLQRIPEPLFDSGGR
jgi:hypothetical protein